MQTRAHTRTHEITLTVCQFKTKFRWNFIKNLQVKEQNIDTQDKLEKKKVEASNSFYN